MLNKIDENVLLFTTKFVKQKQYWTEKLSGEIETTEIQFDSAKKQSQQERKQKIDIEFPDHLSAQLQKLGKKSALSTYIILLAAQQSLIHRYTQITDITIVTPINKLKISGETMNHMLLIRQRQDTGKSFKELILQTRQTVQEAHANQDYPIEKLAEAIFDEPWEPRHNAVSGIASSMENIHDKDNIEGLGVKLSFTFVMEGDQIAGTVTYATDIYEEDQIKRLSSHYTRLLENSLQQLDRPWAKVPFLSEEEKQQLLEDFNDNSAGYPSGKTIYRFIEEHAETTPEAPAVSMDGHTITYRELNDNVNRQARQLRAHGVAEDRTVGILLKRSPLMVTTILAVWKAGGAYIPIDTGNPVSRINEILTDSASHVLITQTPYVEQQLEERYNGAIIKLDRREKEIEAEPADNIDRSHNMDSLAYVIYTSGSTGKPKGAMVEHIGMMNHIQAKIDDLQVTPGSIISQNSSHTFDISVWQFFTALVRGGRTIVYNDEIILDPGRFIPQLEKDGVTILEVVPSYLGAMLELLEIKPTAFDPLVYLLVTGEAVKPTLLTRWFQLYPGIPVVNAYGPTEASDDITHCRLEKAPAAGNVPIGKPVQNLNIYIVDKHMNLCPVGVKGEIVVSGVGVGRGYLNAPEKTAEKFIWDPFLQPPDGSEYTTENRMYRTGDIGCWLPDGSIDFFGRMDHQVKIRGFRIELGEIETQQVKHPAVKEAVVLDKEDRQGNKFLCTYYVCGEKVEIPELKEFLSERLPDYMVPSYFIELDHMPLTPNGKIDRKALPDVDTQRETQTMAPRNKMEEILAEIMGGVLGRTDIGVNENFFEIGGDSIKAIQIASRMYKAGYKIEMRDIFQNPYIAELAPAVKKLEQTADQSVITGSYPLTPIQHEFFGKITEGRHHNNQAVLLKSKDGFDAETTRNVFRQIQQHHDALRVTVREENGRILQTGHGLDYPQSLQEFDYRDKSNEEAAEAQKSKVNEIQASIDLENGPLMKLGLFHRQDGDRLLIVVHHLAIDGVSWRILFEDIETLSNQYKNGETLELPLKTDSFKQWAGKLAEYADSDAFLKEKEYWAQLEAAEAPEIKKDIPEEENKVKDIAQETVKLDENETTHLLTRVNEAFGTDINDILLTGLGQAVRETYRHDKVLIALETHGREEILKDVNINRTVGWFTSVFPLLLDMTHTHDLSRQIVEVKESIRRLPNRGIGHGILKYLTAEENKKEIEFKLSPQVSFNYLGQFDTDVEDLSFEVAGETAGTTQDPESQREHELEVSGVITQKQLMLSISYSKKQYKPESIKALLDNYKKELIRVITYCAGRKETELTPSELTYPHLSIEALDRLKKQYPVKDIYALSPMQEGMLFHTLYEKNSPAYFEQMSYRLHGHLDISNVEKSVNELLKRYEILRTTFIHEGFERPLQVVQKNRQVDFVYEDARERFDGEAGKQEKEDYVKQFKAKDRQRTFDPGKDVLMRVSILQLADAEYEFAWSFHHILMDGWCVGILNSEFLEIYTSHQENRPYRLQTVKPYRTYIQWLEKKDREESKNYWSNYLAGYDETIGVPADRTAEETEGYTNSRVSIEIDSEKAEKLNRLAAGNHVTLNTVVQAMWAVQLGKYNYKQDVVFGAVVSGRPAEIEGVESMVGLFINTVPVRIGWDDRTTFRDLLHKVRDAAVEAESHHHYPLYYIQSATAMKSSLFDHIVVFENYPVAEQIDGQVNRRDKTETSFQVKLTDIDVFEQTNYDYNMVVLPGKKLTIKITYNENRYEKEFIQRIAGHIDRMTEQIIADDRRQVEGLDLLTEAERRRVREEFNRAGEETRPEDREAIHRLFERQVRRTPDNIAVVGLEALGTGETAGSLTYRELNEKADRQARRLAAKGIKPGDIVGITADRTPGMMAAILAILKTGAAYLPLEPDYPEERIQFMMKDAAAQILLVGGTQGKELTGHHETLFIDNELDEPVNDKTINEEAVPASPNDLAYIIYTSGSTGTPKAVMVEHRSVVRLVQKTNYVDFREDDRILQTGAVAFDASTFEIWGALLNGLRLYQAEKNKILDPRWLKHALQENKITIIWMTSPLFNRMSQADTDIFAALRVLLVGGDVLSPVHIDEVRSRNPRLTVINGYGPTENTTFSTTHRIEKEYKGNIPIGTPVSRSTAYILDRAYRQLPVGAVGELAVGGRGIARGYMNRQELTAEKFIDSPYKKGEKLYRTGDLARRQPGGAIEFLGRADRQVKIRGFRIEPGEIESRLQQLEGVTEAVVMDRKDKDGAKYLCAYIVGPDISYKDALTGKLPVYMIPGYFITVPKIPLTPNGKVDRAALPDPAGTGAGSGAQYEAPRNTVEKLLVEAWRHVLGRDNIGIRDDFFMMGGDSIKSIQVASRLNQDGYKVEIKDIFTNPTIAELAQVTGETARIADQSEVTGPVPLTPVQEMFFERWTKDPHHFNQAVMLQTEQELEEETVRAIFRELQNHHDALRMTYREEEGKILQINNGREHPQTLQVFDNRGKEDAAAALEAEANRIQASIRLEKGPLMKLGLFHQDDGDRLLIVIHHLVIDGVSWRILFEDIETLYRRHNEGKPLQLPAKTDSFKTWSGKLRQYADSPAFLEEKNYWKQLEAEEVPPIKTDYDGGNMAIDADLRSFTLDRAETGRLQDRVHHAFGTEINDILLTALALGVKDTFGVRRLQVSQEGHGREEIQPGLDITRTVGWFTSIYPIHLEVPGTGDTARQIKEIKERLRQVPNKGIGYGILKYITHPSNKEDLEFKQQPQLSFNYLGQFDADVKQMTFNMAKESAGATQSTAGERLHQLDVSGMIADDRLKMTVIYNRKQFKPETVETLVNNYKARLEQLIEYCAARETTEPTPSDLTYGQLSIAEVDRLNNRGPLQDIYPLTPLQEGMLFHALFDKKSTAYFEQIAYRLEGELDVAQVEKSLNRLFERYDILRTVFLYEGVRRPLQIVLKDRRVEYHNEDVRGIASREQKEQKIREFKENDRKRGFDLTGDVLMRVSVLQVEDGEYEFVWSFHHILMDGWCISILINEFFQDYNINLSANLSANLPGTELRQPAVKPYRDYIVWLEKQDKKASEKYWKSYLDYYDEAAGFPKIKTAADAAGETFKMEHEGFVIEKETVDAMKRIAANRRVTLNILVQAAWGILLAKYSGKEDVVFGTVVSGRPYELKGVESMVGLFINTIPVRIRINPEDTFHRLIGRLQQEAVESEPHHHYPLAKIQAQSRLKQNLLDHLYVFENYPIAEQINELTQENENNPGIKLTLSKTEVFEQTNYDFGIVIAGSNQLAVDFTFNANVYDRRQVEQISRHLEQLIREMIKNQEQPVHRLDHQSEEEKQRQLYAFNDTKEEYPGDRGIHQQFEEQVEKTPDHVAQVHGDRQVTYRQLNERAARLARTLRTRGVAAGTIAAIMAPRSIDVVVGILAVLKAGGAYLPVDINYPQARIDYIMENSRAEILLTQKSITQTHAPQVIHLDDETSYAAETLPPDQTDPSGNPAYVIYTSGTTGKPKGAVIEHRGVVNYIRWAARNYVKNQRVNFPLYTSISFDLTVTSIFTPLVTGNAIVVYGEDDKEFPIEKIVKENRVDVVKLTPSHLKLIKDKIAVESATGQTRLSSSIKRFIVGGENLESQLAAEINRYFDGNVEIYNEYGPTETVVGCMIYKFDPDAATGGSVPIGKPAANTQIYILDANRNPVPPGVAGELYIGGDGVARGYIGNPEQTSEKFLDNPFVKGGRMYRSGDLAQRRMDGNIEFMGRIDHQVKIRGFRIELAEIESQLQKLDQIKEAVVIDQSNKRGEKYLTAYIVAQKDQEKKPEPAELKRTLSKELPDYMIPTYFVPLEKIPLTPNGKVDRYALPAPEIEPQGQYIAPETENEKVIADAWKEVLELDQVGVDYNFFDLGGTSMEMIRLNSRLKVSLKRDISIVDMFRYPTVKALAAYLGREESEAAFKAEERDEAVERGKKDRMRRLQKRRGAPKR